ncbi:hypothetical protein AB4Z35_01995 [Pseudomonas sp. KB_15]
MDVNDNACEPDKRGVLESIASKAVSYSFSVGMVTCWSWLASDGR